MKVTAALVIFFAVTVFAETKPKPPEAAPRKPHENEVLDFKEQVIEGTIIDTKTDAGGARKGSPLFSELGKGDTAMDSIVFKRADFNDFHDTQMKQRVFVQPAESK